MKLFYTSGFAVVVFFTVAVICGAIDDLPRVVHRGLSLNEFNAMLQTEVINEFGEGTEAEERWNAAAQFEWERAHEVEMESRRRRALRAGRRNTQSNATDADTDALSPFVVCHFEMGKSGEVRVYEIEALFRVSKLVVITNTHQRSCFFMSSTASVASSVAAAAAASHNPPLVVVHPMVPEMKLENIKEVVDRSYSLSSDQHETTSSTHQSSGHVLFDMDRASPARFNSLICPGFPNSVEMANAILDDIRADVVDIGNRRRLRSRTSTRFLRLGEDGESAHRPSERFGRSLSGGFDTPSACDDLLDAISVTVSDDIMTVDIDVDPDTLCHDFSQECLHSLAAALSARRELCTVEASPEMLTMNSFAQWITQSGTDGYRPLFDTGLTGAGQVVAVSDTGLDNDSCYFADSDKGDTPPTTISDKEYYSDRRKVVQYVGFVDDADARNGHGTHVVGTILGRQATDGGETGGTADGVAHGAKVAFFDIGNGFQLLSIPSDTSSLLDPGREAGANIHSASWGSFLNSYTAEARAMDAYMVQHPKFLAIVAAGNSGAPSWWNGNRGTIGSPATNKNGIAVGSSQSEGPDGGSSGMDYLSSFSSRGPTGDGRRKPDITAPGEKLRSAAADPGSSGECGTVAYAGTSMATPVVAGSAALIRQYYAEGFYPTGAKSSNVIDPSAALVKATLINGAVALKGVARRWWGPESIDEYDNNQGFGLINLLNSVPLAGKNSFSAFVKDEEAIRNGETDEYTIGISKSGGCTAEEVSATLVWTDPVPTSGCSDSCLVNNLDLTVRKGSETFYPNGGAGPDNVNNVERTRVEAEDGDEFVITVSGANLIGSQDYALIVTGCLAAGGGVLPRPPTPPTQPTPTPPTPPTTPTPPTPAPPTPTPPGGDDDDDYDDDEYDDNDDPWWCWLFGTCDDDDDF